MPVVPDIAVLAIAGLAFLLAAGSLELIQWFRSAIPNPSIAGLNPLGFVQGMFDSLEGFLVEMMEAAGTAVGDAIQAVEVAASDIFNITTSLFGQHHNMLEYIATELLPRMITQAYAWTNEAETYVLDKLKEDTKESTKYIDEVLHSVEKLTGDLGPIKDGGVGGMIAAAVAAALAAAEAFTGETAKRETAKMNEQLATVHTAIRQLETATASTLPNEIQAQAETERALIDSRTSELKGELAARSENLQTLISEVRTELEKAIELDTRQAHTELDTAQAGLNQAITQAETAAEQVATADLGTAEGRAQADAARAEQHAAEAAQAQLSIKASQLTAQIQQTETHARQELETRLQPLEDELDATGKRLTEVSATGTLNLPGVEGFAPPGLITIPVAVGALGAAVASIENDLDDCVVTNCGSGRNNLEESLKRLLGGLLAVGDLALIAEAIKNPEGSAHLVSPLLDSAAAAGEQELQRVLEIL